MRIFRGLSVTAAAAAVLIGGAARAGDLTGLPDGNGTVVGVGVICNTGEQAEQFISLRQQGRDTAPAVAAVNARARDPRACGVAAIAFVPDRTLATVTVGGRLVKIVKVNVVAGYDGSGWQPIAATVQYAVVETKGEEI